MPSHGTLVDANGCTTHATNGFVPGRNDTGLNTQYDMSKSVTCRYPRFRPAEWMIGRATSVPLLLPSRVVGFSTI